MGGTHVRASPGRQARNPLTQDSDEDVFETNWQKLAAEIEAAGQSDRSGPADEGTAEQATRHLKLVVKNALDAARGAKGKKRR